MAVTEAFLPVARRQARSALPLRVIADKNVRAASPFSAIGNGEGFLTAVDTPAILYQQQAKRIGNVYNENHPSTKRRPGMDKPVDDLLRKPLIHVREDVWQLF